MITADRFYVWFPGSCMCRSSRWRGSSRQSTCRTERCIDPDSNDGTNHWWFRCDRETNDSMSWCSIDRDWRRSLASHSTASRSSLPVRRCLGHCQRCNRAACCIHCSRENSCREWAMCAIDEGHCRTDRIDPIAERKRPMTTWLLVWWTDCSTDGRWRFFRTDRPTYWEPSTGFLKGKRMNRVSICAGWARCLVAEMTRISSLAVLQPIYLQLLNKSNSFLPLVYPSDGSRRERSGAYSSSSIRPDFYETHGRPLSLCTRPFELGLVVKYTSRWIDINVYDQSCQGHWEFITRYLLSLVTMSHELLRSITTSLLRPFTAAKQSPRWTGRVGTVSAIESRNRNSGTYPSLGTWPEDRWNGWAFLWPNWRRFLVVYRPVGHTSMWSRTISTVDSSTIDSDDSSADTMRWSRSCTWIAFEWMVRIDSCPLSNSNENGCRPTGRGMRWSKVGYTSIEQGFCRMHPSFDTPAVSPSSNRASRWSVLCSRNYCCCCCRWWLLTWRSNLWRSHRWSPNAIESARRCSTASTKIWDCCGHWDSYWWAFGWVTNDWTWLSSRTCRERRCPRCQCKSTEGRRRCERNASFPSWENLYDPPDRSRAE